MFCWLVVVCIFNFDNPNELCNQKLQGSPNNANICPCAVIKPYLLYLTAVCLLVSTSSLHNIYCKVLSQRRLTLINFINQLIMSYTGEMFQSRMSGFSHVRYLVSYFMKGQYTWKHAANIIGKSPLLCGIFIV